jgi:prevent-host-death family protein
MSWMNKCGLVPCWSSLWSYLDNHVCYNVSMKKIAAGEFKARCLALMEDVRSKREPLLITKRGKPVVKLVPVDDEKDEFFDRLRGMFRVVGDIEAPIPDKWEAS